MTLADTGSAPPGFRFIGTTKDELWGKFVLDDGRTSSSNWNTSIQQRQRRQPSQRDSDRQRPSQGVSAQVRDPFYRQLLDQLTLHPEDRADLHRRGLTDAQIDAWGVKSTEQWQQLQSPLPPTLPGVRLDGMGLNCQPGYLCPIQDVQEHLVGFQLRLRTDNEGGRYRWLTSTTKNRPDGPTPHLPNGELPLAVHRPPQLLRRAIAFAEGVGAKPFITAQRQGQVVVGAAGGQFASSPETLKATLETLAQELGTKTIEFYPDAGTLQNRHVLRQYRATWKLLRKWGYGVQVAWWGQTTKASPDIDELDDCIAIGWLSTAQFEALAHPRLDWLERIRRTLQNKPQPTQSAAALRARFGKQDISQYPLGQRLSIWQRAIDDGYRYILDTSPPGAGKSFDAGQMDPQTFGVKQLIYASDQHRNPTVLTLTQENGWVDLEARHGGLVQEITPMGGVRLKRANQRETSTLAANCSRHQLLGMLRAKHVHGSDTASLICSTCPLREPCTHSNGPGYGFLNQRRSALSSPKLRAHLDSLPDPSDYSLADTLLLVDEPGQNFRVKQDLKVTLPDLEQTILRLMEFPGLFQALQPLLVALIPMLDGSTKLGRFGIAHSELMQRLPQVTLDGEAVSQVLRPDLGFLNSTAVHGVDLADLPRQVRKKFAERDSELADQAQQRVIKQWLPELLHILTGHAPGASMRLGYDGLTLTLPDGRHRFTIEAARATIFLDGTLHPQDLALKLGCAVDEIFVCQQQVPSSENLTLIQVTDLGRLGMQRGNQQQQRASAIVAHYQQQDPTTQTLDFKKFASEGTGCWWRDSRGINDFERTTRLILVGTPCRNLADLQAEYGVLSGQYPRDDDVQYRAYVDRSILSEFHQAIGRLRAHRRAETPLEIILLSDFELDCPTQKVKASDITLNASTKRERFFFAVQAAIQQLKVVGAKITQRAISALIPYSQQYVSRHWKLLQTLLESPNSKTSQNIDSDSQEVCAMVVPVLEKAISGCETAAQVLETVNEIFYGWLKPIEWIEVWERLSGRVQTQIFTALTLTLPSEHIEPFLEEVEELGTNQ
jgi:hypothetical protein